MSPDRHAIYSQVRSRLTSASASSKSRITSSSDVPWPPKNREHLDQIIDETKRRDVIEDQ